MAGTCIRCRLQQTELMLIPDVLFTVRVYAKGTSGNHSGTIQPIDQHSPDLQEYPPRKGMYTGQSVLPHVLRKTIPCIVPLLSDYTGLPQHTRCYPALIQTRQTRDLSSTRQHDLIMLFPSRIEKLPTAVPARFSPHHAAFACPDSSAGSEETILSADLPLLAEEFSQLLSRHPSLDQ